MLEARSSATGISRSFPKHYDEHADRTSKGKQRRRIRLISIPFILIAGGLFFVLAIIAQYSSIVSLNSRLGRAESRMATLQEEYRQLEKEAAELSSLARVEVIARTELGMREPESGQLRVLTASRESLSVTGE